MIPDGNLKKLNKQLSSLTVDEPASENHMIHLIDGKEFWVSWINRGIFDEDGNLVEHLAVGRDITDRKEAERALKESEEKFRTLAESTPSAIFIYNSVNMVYANPKAAEILGYSVDEIKTMPFWKIIHPDSRDKIKGRGIQRLKGDNVPSSYEVKVVTKYNKTKWMLFSGDLVDYQGEKMVLGSAFDITEKKETEEKLRKADYEKYQQARQIAGGVSHEIYNALFPAVSSLNKLKDRLHLYEPSEIERNQKLISLIDTALERAMSMTDIVTQYSKIDSQTDIAEINLKEFLENLIKDNAILIGNSFKLETNLQNNIIIKISENHLFSLLNNLLRNAMDSLEENTEKIIGVKSEFENGKIRIEISDNGNGIPDDIKDQIFNPFFSTKPRTGTGIGLAICKRIVDIYNGEINFESSVDRGTKFVIFFPASGNE
jgi:PAS domain S-box-containing protein